MKDIFQLSGVGGASPRHRSGKFNSRRGILRAEDYGWGFLTLMLESLFADIRYGLRMLSKSVAFTSVSILALALGIGANTAIFSIVDAVLLHPLPYKDPGRLVWVSNVLPREGDVVFDADYFAFRRRNHVFEDIAAYSLGDEFTLTGTGEAVQLHGARVTSIFFHVLGVEPQIGRLFAPSEDQPGGARVIILSNSLWRHRFSSSPGIVGQSVALNGDSYTVIGVLPASFEFLDNTTADVIVPFRLEEHEVPSSPRLMILRIVARLRFGITPKAAAAELNAINASVHVSWGRYARMFNGSKAQVIPLRDRLTGNVRPALLLLFGAVAFLLLVACANIANLQIARAVVRKREMAIRETLGAGRGRLARQLLTESSLLGLFGGAGGIMLSFWVVALVRAIGPESVPHLQNAHVDVYVLLFTMGLSLLTGILSGIAPLAMVFRVSLNEELKESGSHGGTGLSVRHPQQILMVTQLSLALLLFVGAGLLVRSFVRLVSQPIGFDPSGVLTAKVSLPDAAYVGPDYRRGFIDRLVAQIRALPGVTAAGAAGRLPLAGFEGETGISLHGAVPLPSYSDQRTYLDVVTPGYFSSLHISLLEGRFLDSHDTTDAESVVVINQAFKDHYFPNEDPVGQRITTSNGNTRRIVGIIADTKQTGLGAEVEPEIFIPFQQSSYPNVTLVIRSPLDSKLIVPQVRAQLRRIDNTVPLYSVATFEERLSVLVAPQRFDAMVLAAFAGLAVLLAAVGLYGVVAYAVGERTHEIGIRLALGAERTDVLYMVLGEGLRLAIVGIAIGVLGSLAMTRFMQALLYGVTPTDPVTFIGVTLLLLAVALAACWIPARLATRVDPMIVLRFE